MPMSTCPSICSFNKAACELTADHAGPHEAQIDPASPERGLHRWPNVKDAAAFFAGASSGRVSFASGFAKPKQGT